MTNDKSLREFLVLLDLLNKANIDFLDGKKISILLGSKYDEEFKKIQDVINSFDFIKIQV